MPEEYDSSEATLLHKESVKRKIDAFCQKMYVRAENHDNSKLEEPEKSVFDEVTPKLRTLEYSDDPESPYQKQLKEMGEGLMHHWKTNSHHPEFYGIPTEDGSSLAKMDIFDLVEFLFDNMAATERSDSSNFPNSVDKAKSRFGMCDQLASIFMNTFERIKNDPAYGVKK